MEYLPSELLIKILFYSGEEGTNSYISITNDERAKDNYLWYNFSKAYYTEEYDSSANYYDDINYLSKMVRSDEKICFNNRFNGKQFNYHGHKYVLDYLRSTDVNLVFIKYLVEKYGINYIYPHQENYAAPATLIFNIRDPKIADWLFSKGADISIIKTQFDTKIFLHKLTTCEMMKWFIEHGANVNAIDICGRQTLNLCNGVDDLDRIKILVENGADINHRDNYGSNVLTYLEGTKVFKYLYKKGINIHNIDNFGRNSLHNLSDAKQCAWLIKHGLDVNQKGEDGLNALFYVTDLEVVKLLIFLGADTELLTPEGYGLISSHIDKLDVLSYLLEKGYAKIDDLYITSMEYVCTIRDAKILTLLVQYGLNINDVDSEGEGILHYIARDFTNEKHLVETVVSLGGDINAVNNDGKSPLFFVTNTNASTFFIDNGARFDIVDKTGATPEMVNRFVRFIGRQ